LCSQNNNLGAFKTACYKLIKIQDLRVKFYQYSSNPFLAQEILAASLPQKPFSGKRTAENQDAKPDIISAETLGIPEGCRVNIDLSNVTEIKINNFDYQLFNDNRITLSVRSKQVTASSLRFVMLRGHVTITAADGSCLESNYIKWDTEKQTFAVNGSYVLTSNGEKTVGKNICVGEKLKKAEEKYVSLDSKEKTRCFAKQ